MRSSFKYIILNILTISVFKFLISITRNTIKATAKKNKIRYMYQRTINNDFLNLIISLKPDYIINGTSTILDKRILDIPNFGVLNIHGAPLPEYRGAGNYIWMLKDKRKYAYSTLHYVDEGLDSGDIIMNSEKVYIKQRMSAFELWLRIRLETKDLFRKLEYYFDSSKKIPSYSQDHQKASNRSLPRKNDIIALQKSGHRILKFTEILLIIKYAITGKLSL